MLFFRSTVVVLFVLGLSQNLAADPIIFTHEGSGMFVGEIDGTAFTSSNIVITATGDTDDVQDLGFGFALEHATATIDIEGVGQFEFLSDTRTFVNNLAELVGFSRSENNALSGNDLFNGPQDGVFASWDLASSIGPVQGTGDLIQWDDPSVITDGGVLVFDFQLDVDTTFTATVVPEPSVTMVMLTIVGGLCFTRRKL